MGVLLVAGYSRLTVLPQIISPHSLLIAYSTLRFIKRKPSPLPLITQGDYTRNQANKEAVQTISSEPPPVNDKQEIENLT